MTNQELDTHFEIIRCFLHTYIDRPIKTVGPQSSEEWLKSIGFFDDGYILPNMTHDKWRIGLGMLPKIKEYRFFHKGELVPMNIRAIKHFN